MLNTDVWFTIGFTYNEGMGKYCLIKDNNGVCLACASRLIHTIDAFCFRCKAPRPRNWTTGNRSLDLFIKESWSNVESLFDAYIQWIEYPLLTDIQQITSLHYGCTLTAKWLESTTANKWTRVKLRKIIDRQDAQLFDFYQVNNSYDKIMRIVIVLHVHCMFN